MGLARFSVVGQLTPRQRMVALGMMLDLTNAQIGEVMGVAERTIKNHADRIFKRLRVSSRDEILRALTTWRAE